MFLKDCRDLLMFQCIKEIRSRVEIKSLRRQEDMESRAQVELACERSPHRMEGEEACVASDQLVRLGIGESPKMFNLRMDWSNRRRPRSRRCC